MVHNKFRNQQRWVLFLLHARTCKRPGVECPDRNCITVQNLLSHMKSCVDPQCLYPRCCHTKTLISHYTACKDLQCPVCVPVKTYLQQQANVLALTALASLKIESSTVDKALGSNDSVRSSDGAAGFGVPH